MLASLAGAAVLALVVAAQPQPELPAGPRSSRWPSCSASAPAGCSPGWPCARRRSGSARVTGIVGAAGGLGGFFPPLVMGATYDEAAQHYTVGLVLLCLTAVIAVIFVLLFLKREPSAERASSPVSR